MAGDMDVSQFLGSGPDLGALSQKSFINDAKEVISALRSEAHVGNTAVAQFGETAGHGAVTEARANYAAAQQQASNMSQLGGLAGNVLSGFGGMFGGGGGGGGSSSLGGMTGAFDSGVGGIMPTGNTPFTY